MSRIRSALTAGAIVLGSSAALLTGGIAKAEPAPAPAPAIPAVPDLNMLTQLINPSTAPQLLQAATAMFNPKPSTGAAVTPAAAPVAPAAAPAPLATAALNLPQVPSAPVAQAPVLGNSGDLPASAMPSGQLNIPNVPGLPVPLPEQLSFPGDLASLMPGAPGAAPTTPAYTVPTAAANSPMPGIATLFPTSALP